MSRSALTHLLVVVFLGLAPRAWAAKPGRPVILAPSGAPQYDTAVASLRQALPEAVVLDANGPDGAKRLPPSSVVVAVGEKAWELAKMSSQDSPVVFCMVLGAARSDPALHTYGVPIEPSPAQALANILALLPSARRVGVLYNGQTSASWLEEAQRAARSAGVMLVSRNVDSPAKVAPAAEALRASIDVLWLPIDPRLFSKDVVPRLLEQSAASHLPVIGFLHTLTKVGALASVAPDYQRIGALAGQLAQQVAKGEHPASLTYATGDLTVNQSVAKQLGLTLSPAVLSKASYVYR